MPINNSLVLINGSSIRPVPRFSISNSPFKSGEYTIGGTIIVRLDGQVIGLNTTDLNNKIKAISQYNAKCQTIKIACEGSVVIDGVGFVKDLNFSSTDQPFIVNYSMQIEVEKNFGLVPILPDQEFLNLYGLNLPSSVLNISEYDESVELSGDDNLANTAIWGGGVLTRPSVKFGVSLSIAAYSSPCSQNDDTALIYEILKVRAAKLISLSAELASSYPILSRYLGGSWFAFNDTKKLTVDKLNNKISWNFDMYILHTSCETPLAIVDLNITENTDQTTGLSSYNVAGNAKGLIAATDFTLDHRTTSSEKIQNARNAFDFILSNGSTGGSFYETYLAGCFNAGQKPSTACYPRSSATSAENVNAGQIKFNLKFEDVEYCELGGVTIDFNVSRDYPVQKSVNFIVPGRGFPIVQTSNGYTAPKLQITTNGRMNSCNTEDIATLISCVESAHNNVTALELAKAGVLLKKKKEERTRGKYSFKIVSDYIGIIGTTMYI